MSMLMRTVADAWPSVIEHRISSVPRELGRVQSSRKVAAVVLVKLPT